MFFYCDNFDENRIVDSCENIPGMFLALCGHLLEIRCQYKGTPVSSTGQLPKNMQVVRKERQADVLPKIRNSRAEILIFVWTGTHSQHRKPSQLGSAYDALFIRFTGVLYVVSCPRTTCLYA